MHSRLLILLISLVPFVGGCSYGITYIRDNNIGYSVCDNNRFLTSAADDAAFNWSPDGHLLAHVRRDRSLPEPANNLYIRNMQSGAERELVSHLYGNVGLYFDWSADGSAIVFEHDVCLGCNANLSVVNLSDGSTRLMTPLSTNDMQPDWSPEGNRLAFVSHGDGSGADIYWMNSNATGRTRLTDTVDNDNHPVWSPDSSRIAFIRRQSASVGHYSIVTVSVSALSRTERVLVSGFNSIGYLSWSPDGSKLIFHGRQPGMERYAIFTVNADGSDMTNLSPVENRIYQDIEDMFPSWSPDGSEVAFSRAANYMRGGVTISARGMLFKMNADGRAKRRVTDQIFTHTTGWRPAGIICF